jgi:hypothetical protein
MGKENVGETLKRREVLTLAGTAAAFCASFGFLHGHAESGQAPAQRLHKNEATAETQHKWERAELKWYSGATLLYSSAIPAEVAKHLESDVNATVEIKLFRSGQLLRNLGAIQGKH